MTGAAFMCGFGLATTPLLASASVGQLIVQQGRRLVFARERFRASIEAVLMTSLTTEYRLADAENLHEPVFVIEKLGGWRQSE